MVHCCCPIQRIGRGRQAGIARIGKDFQLKISAELDITSFRPWNQEKERKDSIAVILRSADQMMYRKTDGSEEMKQQTVANIEASAKGNL